MVGKKGFILLLVLVLLLSVFSVSAFTILTYCSSSADCTSAEGCVITDYSSIILESEGNLGYCNTRCTSSSDCDSDSSCTDTDDDGTSECVPCSDDSGDYVTYSEVSGVDPNGDYFSGEYCSSTTVLRTGSCGGAESNSMILYTTSYTCSNYDPSFACFEGACTYSSGCTTDSFCGDGYSCDEASGVCFVDANGDGVTDECYYSTDCATGETCSAGSCVAYCAISETECSDGIDNDGDGYYDYGGSCTIDDVVYPCSALPDGTGGTLDYSGVDGSLEECEAVCTPDYTFIDGDTNCRSPLDTDESSDPSCATAADDDGDGDGGMYGVSGGTNVDPDCTSPEGAESTSLSYAPEVSSESFFARVWNWIVFWN